MQAAINTDFHYIDLAPSKKKKKKQVLLKAICISLVSLRQEAADFKCLKFALTLQQSGDTSSFQTNSAENS